MQKGEGAKNRPHRGSNTGPSSFNQMLSQLSYVGSNHLKEQNRESDWKKVKIKQRHTLILEIKATNSLPRVKENNSCFSESDL